MRTVEYTRLGHTLIEERLDNGLTVLLVPKPGFRQTFASFTTHYGSLDSVFRTAPDSELQQVPDGIAHFLEHKMFDKEHGDVFTEFAKHGASANAFTTFDHTTYLFSCTEDLDANVNTLLDFVQDPYFSDQSVEKEKGIIAEEIRMYEDKADWRVYFDLLKALFVEHPVRVPIAGTVESITAIDKDLLYLCHRTFYHPSNMVFLAVGGFDPQHMLDVIRTNQGRKSFPPAPQIERWCPDEPERVAQPRTTATLAVNQPRCMIGWKEGALQSGAHCIEQEIVTGVILDALFGRASAAYHRWIDEGLIDQNFSWDYERTQGYGYSIIGGVTTDPDLLAARVQATVEQAVANGLDEDDFHRCCKKAIGRFIAMLDSPAYLARSVVSDRLRHADTFHTIEVLERLTVDDANRRLRDHFREERMAVSVVLPR